MPTYQQNTGSGDLLPEGAYGFRVKNAEEVTSKNGNEMIRLTLEVNGSFELIDHLVFTPNAFWKIDQFRIATGEKLGKPGSDASIEAYDCIARKGLVAVNIEIWEGRERNKVAEYLDSATTQVVATPRATATATVAPKTYKPRPDLRPEPNDIPF